MSEPYIVIRSIEARRHPEPPPMTAARRAEQVRKLAAAGIRVPAEERGKP